MDWQTKDYIDERFNDIDDKLELIMQHLDITQAEDDLEEELGGPFLPSEADNEVIEKGIKDVQEGEVIEDEEDLNF